MKTIFLPLCVATTVLVMPAGVQAGEWGIGAGVIQHQPAQQGAKSEIVGGPFPFYEGERLSVGFGNISYVVAAAGAVRLALEGQARFEGYDPDKSAALAGMKTRNPAFEVGMSVATGGDWGIAQLKYVGDITGTHEGYEVSAAYQMPLQVDRWTLVPSLSVDWRSKELVDYYYGVRDDEVQVGRPAYRGRAGLNVTAGIGVDYQLSDHWNIVGGADITYLGDNIQDSPIIAKDTESSVYTALVYRF